MTKEKKILMVPLSKITPDKDQPRRNFNALRLADLKKSIKKHGILSPLIVEERPEGYLLVDGERRFITAKSLKLKTVPVIVMKKQSDTQRLVQQFHLQEQHEGWSSLEKATAVIKLAKELKITLSELTELLNLPRRTLEEYNAYSKLIAQKEYAKFEIPIIFASSIVYLRDFVKKTVVNVAEVEFTHNDEKNLELAIIARIKNGEIKLKKDLNKIRDSVRQEPKSIFKFIKDSKITIDGLFLKTNAKVAYYFRHAVYGSTHLVKTLEKGKPLGLIHHFNNDMTAQRWIKRLHRELGEFIKEFEDKLED